MNKKQKIKRIEELLMEHHIHNGLCPTNKTLKLNRKYLLDEIRNLVNKKTKVTTPNTPSVVLKGSDLLYSHVMDKAIKTPNEYKPFDRWYLCDSISKSMLFIRENECYGPRDDGGWFRDKSTNIIEQDSYLATDKEIVQRLSAYATSIGIKARGTFKSIGIECLIKIEDKSYAGFEYNPEFNSLLFNGWVVMKDGKWATVVKQSDTPTTYINHDKK